MEHYKKTSELGSNIYLGASQKNIDHICLEAVIFWYRESEKFDFDNPSYSDKTGNAMHFLYKPIRNSNETITH